MEAQTAMMVAGAFGGGRRLRIASFLPFGAKAKPQAQTPDEMEAVFGRFEKAHNRRNKRRKARKQEAE